MLFAAMERITCHHHQPHTVTGLCRSRGGAGSGRRRALWAGGPAAGLTSLSAEVGSLPGVRPLPMGWARGLLFPIPLTAFLSET